VGAFSTQAVSPAATSPTPVLPRKRERERTFFVAAINLTS
jgi:hypothetical protein